MEDRERQLRRLGRNAAGIGIAGALLACLFLLVGLPAQAGETPDAGFLVAPAPEGPHVTSAAEWDEFTPTGWVTQSLITAGISVTDTDGLQETTAQYRYSTDGGSSWFSWGQSNLNVVGPLTMTKRMTVTNLFLPDSATQNRVMFRVLDGGAMTETSLGYPVQVDATLPGSVVTTNGWFKTLTTIAGTGSDATSGVSRVDIRIQRSSDNQYYNGSGWQVNPLWLLAAGTTSWTYPFAPSETVTYTVSSRATDNAGLVQTAYGAGTISFDNTAPTSAVGTNGFYRTVTWTGAITGTASDVGSGVQKVEITVRRINDNLYYNGSGWQGSAVWLLTTGTADWSYPFAPTAGVTYEVRSRATDNVDNQQPTPGSGTFMLDINLPTSSVTTSGYYGVITWTGNITGTAYDGESGVVRVELTIRRDGDMYYYNGAWWQATPVWLLTSGTTNWYYPFAPEHGRTYSVQSRAQDQAGNQQIAYGTGTIVHDNGVPTSSVTSSGLLGKAAWGGAVAGTATDDFAGVDKVHITLQRATDGKYFDGATWAGTASWLLASGTNAWSYVFAPTQGITYTVQSRATDRAGNVQTVLGMASFSYDGTDPASTVGMSGYYGAVTWTGAITGTATDGESGLQSVVLSVERISDHMYWNGTIWQALEVWLTATGTANWSYAFAAANGQSYRISAKATDRAGNEQALPSQSTFTYDSVSPVSSILTSGFFRFETWLGNVEGTASDDASGLSSVELTLQRWVDNYFYNGSGWQPTEYWLAVTGTDTWLYAFAPTDGMTYTARSRAVDVAGNVQAVYGSGIFSYDLQSPDSQVGTNGYYSAVTWTGQITGTATDAASGIMGVAITVQRPSDSRYWNGAAWQIAQTWITATGTTEWSYPLSVTSGLTYTVRSRAVDKAGNTETSYGSGTFGLDLEEPDSQVGSVGFYRPVTWTGAITGTASAGVSGVSLVQITVQRSTDNRFYNGTGWQLTTQWLTATGTVEWLYPFSPVEAVTYTVQSRAWSASGNQETTYGMGQFAFDGAAPSVVLGTSGAYNSATWTGIITGTAADAGAGVDYVDFTLRRSSDNKYFSGIAWLTNLTWLRAIGTEAWSYTFTPPVEAEYTLQMRPADRAGNVQDPPVPASFVLDNTAPFAPTDPHYYDGWKNTNVFTVTWTNAPDTSGIAGAYYKFAPPTSPTDGVRYVQTTNSITDIAVPAEGIWDLHLWLQDNAGNVNHNRRLVWPAMFKYDATPPATTHAFSGPAGSNGWFRGTVTVTLTATDQVGLSGVDKRFYRVDAAAWMTTTSTFLVSGEGVHDFDYYSTDIAGNVEATQSYTVGIDTIAPSVTHAYSGTLSPSGWYTAPVTVILSGTDLTSGVDDGGGYRYRMGTLGPWLSAKTFVVGGEGTRTFYYYALDRAGNESDVMSGTIQVDTVPPLTSIQITGAVGDNGWYRSTVGVTISATDATSGPAPDEIYHRLDSGPWIKANTVGISTDGDHELEHYAVDLAGNRGEPVLSPVRVDTTPPTAPLALNPSPTVWTNVNQFSITWTPPADTSGIAGAYYKLDAEPASNYDGVFVLNGSRIDNISVSGEGMHSITVWLRDRAGNTSFLNRAARINAFLYDPLAPTTNTSLNGTLGNNGWFTSPVTVTFTTQDQPGLSGVSGLAYRVNPSGWVTRTGVASASTLVDVPGKQVVEFRGMDGAGNIETVRSLTVRMDNQPPGRPTDLLVSPTGWSKGSTYTVTWKNPLPADHSGIAAVHYKLNAPPTGPTDGTRVAVVVPSVEINVVTNGEHNLYVWLEDMAGNVGHQNYAWLPRAVRRDAEPPSVSHTVMGTLGSESWYITPVTVTLAATDSLSGLAVIRYQVDGGSWATGNSVVVSSDGPHTVTYKAEDVAGNQSGAVAVSFKIDRSAPWVVINPTPVFQTHPSFTISWAGLDPSPGSGVSRYDVQAQDGRSGAWVDWLTNTDQTSAPYAGQRGHTYGFRARARDVAGNLGDYPLSAQLLVQVSPMVNGDLEVGNFNGWTLGCTPAFNRGVVRAPDYRGVEGWVARLGDPAYSRTDNLPSVPVGAACMSQTFTVPTPNQMVAPTLSFWYHIYTYDVVQGADGTLYDSFDVTITAQGGSPQLLLRDGNFTQPITSVLVLRDLGWREAVVDLTPFAGQTVTIQFANWNREKSPGLTMGWYNTWTLVDGVQLQTRLHPRSRLPVALLRFDGTRPVRTSGIIPVEALEASPVFLEEGDGFPRR